MSTTHLIPCSNVLLVAVNVNTLSDVRRLLLQCHKDIAGLIVKACAGDRQQKLKTPFINKSPQTAQSRKKKKPTTCRTFAGVIVSNLADGVADNFLVVHCGTRCHLTGQQDHSSLGNGLCTRQKTKTNSQYKHLTQANINTEYVVVLTTCNLGIGILLEMGVENCIADLITDLVCKKKKREECN